jgi:hypothetical protein
MSMRVRLTIEQTDAGLRATVRERSDRDGQVKDRSDTFLVESVSEAKRRAAAVARQNGLTSYGVVDKTRPKA